MSNTNPNSNPILNFAKNLLNSSGNSKILFKNKNNNTKKNLSDEEKRIFIRTYYIPMLYLLYSYYYTKFYRIQKIRLFRIENKFNYDNITLLFDKQNPAMKKINVYLYENFKKGKIEKLAPIDENISGDIIEKKETVIKFLENINKVLEKNIDLINERLKKDNQIVYDLNQYLKHLMKLYDLIYENKNGQKGGVNIKAIQTQLLTQQPKNTQNKKNRQTEMNKLLKGITQKGITALQGVQLKTPAQLAAQPATTKPISIQPTSSATTQQSSTSSATTQSAFPGRSSNLSSKLTTAVFTQNYISQFIISHETIISKLLTSPNNLNQLITTINQFPIDKLKDFLIKISNENELNNFIESFTKNSTVNTKLQNTMEYKIYEIVKDDNEIFEFIKDIFEQQYVSQSNIQEGGSNYYERIKNLLEALKGLTQAQFNDIKNKEKDIDYDSDILDILKTINKPNKLDDIYLNYKEAVRLINNTNIDLILRNEYDKEEDIITRINFNSIYTVSKIIENINEKVILNNKNKEKYKIFINKNDKLIDLLDNEKELIKGFLEKIKGEKMTPQLIMNYKTKFEKIKKDIFNLFTNISLNEKNIDNEKNNLEDLLNIIYRSIYINEEIEYNYLNLKLNKDHNNILINSGKSLKDIPIIQYEFYIDNILQRYKKEKKDKTKLIDKTMDIFKKDIQDLKKKITTDKEIHERESNVIAQKSKNIIKIEADKKREIEEERRKESEISQIRAKLRNTSSYSKQTQAAIADLKFLEGITTPISTNITWTSRSLPQGGNYTISNDEKFKELIEDVRKLIEPKYKDYEKKLNALEKSTTISFQSKNDNKKKLEKNIEDYKKLKSLIEYKIKQTDDI